MVEGSLTQETAPRLSKRSRIVPPPIPVTVAIRQKPTMSICLRDAVSAPLAAKTPTPQSSSQWMKLSTERLLAGHPSKKPGIRAVFRRQFMRQVDHEARVAARSSFADTAGIKPRDARFRVELRETAGSVQPGKARANNREIARDVLIGDTRGRPRARNFVPRGWPSVLTPG